ncbi:MAG: hypothetical protein HFF38_06145 [Lawsonibacter sp.]|nr:hypothetical protein [Lawsonibacter sp.]
MKRKISILLTVSVFLLLAGCGENAQNDDSAIQTDAPHTFAGYPVVYLTADISAQGLLSAYEALEPAENGTVGIKLSETLSDGFSWQDLTVELVQAANASIIENNGPETELSGYENIVVLTHLEPHDTVGFYGTTAHMASISTQQEDLDRFASDPDGMLQYLAEQGKAAAESVSGPILYIAVLDQWSVGDPAYGGNILASYDPVSLDQACVDLINMTEECQSLAAHIAVCKGIYTLVNAEQMGWGSRTYAFLSID